jgi:hypothetical protein
MRLQMFGIIVSFEASMTWILFGCRKSERFSVIYAYQNCALFFMYRVKLKYVFFSQEAINHTMH